jgi:hypothetical protein
VLQIRLRGLRGAYAAATADSVAAEQGEQKKAAA